MMLSVISPFWIMQQSLVEIATEILIDKKPCMQYTFTR